MAIFTHRKPLTLGTVLLFFWLLVACGCSGKPVKQDRDDFFRNWKDFARKSQPASPAAKREQVTIPNGRHLGTQGSMDGPDPRSEEAPPPGGDTADASTGPEALPESPASSPSFPTVEISIKMYDVRLSVLLRTLARAADQNILISENVTGTANINIKNVPWDKAFSAILRTYGLTYSWEGNIIRIFTLQDLDHQMKLIEADQQLLNKRQETELALLEIEQRKASKQEEIRLIEPLETRLIPIQYADAAKLKRNLEQFFPKTKEGSGRGAIALDEHTQALIIQATRSDLEMMIPLIEALDQPTSQVLIEAHIVEAGRDTAWELGVKWGGLYGHERGSKNYWITPGIGGEGVIGETLEEPIAPSTGLFTNPATLESETGLNIGFLTERPGQYILQMQLSALQREGKLNILSSPSITTMDNQPATIESGREVPFQTVEDDEVNIEFKKAVLSLTVVPHVIGKDTLRLNILTHKDELDFSNDVNGNPTIITKKAETNVILFDGETAVIGGLTKETASENESGIPLLKEIPLVGALFKGRSRDSNMEEVLIFITPHILKPRSLIGGIDTRPNNGGD